MPEVLARYADVPEEMPLEAYRLVEIMPLIYLDESLESFRKLQHNELRC